MAFLRSNCSRIFCCFWIRARTQLQSQPAKAVRADDFRSPAQPGAVFPESSERLWELRVPHVFGPEIDHGYLHTVLYLARAERSCSNGRHSSNSLRSSANSFRE